MLTYGLCMKKLVAYLKLQPKKGMDAYIIFFEKVIDRAYKKECVRTTVVLVVLCPAFDNDAPLPLAPEVAGDDRVVRRLSDLLEVEHGLVLGHRPVAP